MGWGDNSGNAVGFRGGPERRGGPSLRSRIVSPPPFLTATTQGRSGKDRRASQGYPEGQTTAEILEGVHRSRCAGAGELQQVSAVYGDRDSSDVTSRFGAEEQYDASHVLWVPETAEGRALSSVIQHL